MKEYVLVVQWDHDIGGSFIICELIGPNKELDQLDWFREADYALIGVAVHKLLAGGVQGLVLLLLQHSMLLKPLMSEFLCIRLMLLVITQWWKLEVLNGTNNFTVLRSQVPSTLNVVDDLIIRVHHVVHVKGNLLLLQYEVIEIEVELYRVRIF